VESPSQEELQTLCSEFSKGVVIKDRRYRFRQYKQCFVGSEAVLWLVSKGKCSSRQDAVKLGQKFMDEGLFCHVTEDHQFMDSYKFYKLNTPEVADKQKKERQAFSKEGWLQKKGLISWNKYWFSITGNIVNYYDKPHGTLRGSFNVLGCKISDNPKDKLLFEITWRILTYTLKSENEKEKNSWISVICRAKDRVLTERQQLLELWKKEDECIACIAALAEEEEEKEESEGNTVVEVVEESKDQGKEKNDKEVLLGKLFALPVASVEQQALVLGDVFKKDIVVLSLLRHFG